jgi:hypothetical protein
VRAAGSWERAETEHEAYIYAKRRRSSIDRHGWNKREHARRRKEAFMKA